jgi:hypothetical protein
VDEWQAVYEVGRRRSEGLDYMTLGQAADGRSLLYVFC